MSSSAHGNVETQSRDAVQPPHVAYYVADEGRDSRAQGLLQENKVGVPRLSPKLDGFLVECFSSTATALESTPQVYYIWIGYNGVATCDCWDFKRRGGFCKHLRAAFLRIDQLRANGQQIPNIPIPTSKDAARLLQAIVQATNTIPARIMTDDNIRLPSNVSAEAAARVHLETFDLANLKEALDEHTVSQVFKVLEVTAPKLRQLGQFLAQAEMQPVHLDTAESLRKDVAFLLGELDRMISNVLVATTVSRL